METTPKDQAYSLTSLWTLIQQRLRAEVTPNSIGPSMSFNNDDSAPGRTRFCFQGGLLPVSRSFAHNLLKALVVWVR